MGLTVFCGLFFMLSLNDHRIVHIILAVPRHIVMYLNNVMSRVIVVTFLVALLMNKFTSTSTPNSLLVHPNASYMEIHFGTPYTLHPNVSIMKECHG